MCCSSGRLGVRAGGGRRGPRGAPAWGRSRRRGISAVPLAGAFHAEQTPGLTRAMPRRRLPDLTSGSLERHCESRRPPVAKEPRLRARFPNAAAMRGRCFYRASSPRPRPRGALCAGRRQKGRRSHRKAGLALARGHVLALLLLLVSLSVR